MMKNLKSHRAGKSPTVVNAKQQGSLLNRIPFDNQETEVFFIFLVFK